MEARKYLLNEKDNINEILQVSVIGQNTSNAPFFVDNITPVESRIPSTFSFSMGPHVYLCRC